MERSRGRRLSERGYGFAALLLATGLVHCAPAEVELKESAGKGGTGATGGTGTTGTTSGASAPAEVELEESAGKGGTGATGGTGTTSGASALPDGVLSRGESALVMKNGIARTFVDRSGTSQVAPYMFKHAPSEELQPELGPGISLGNGIEREQDGNLAFHITGYVGPNIEWEAPYRGDETYSDKYWDMLYGSICKDGSCGELAWPRAGLALRLQEKSHVTDLSAYWGVAFRLRLGEGHGVEEDGSLAHNVTITAPMDLTDAPDPAYGEEFGQQVDGRWEPICTFAGTPKADGNVVQFGHKTCFWHFDGPSLRPLPSLKWQQYCLAWDDFSWPIYSDVYKITKKLDPKRLLGFDWNAHVPAPWEPATNFDFWVDDVVLLDKSNWKELCGDQDPNRSSASSTPASSSPVTAP